MTLARAALVLTWLGLAGAGVAHARAPEDTPQLDDDFGPLVEIERIAIVGNSRTAERLIRRALDVHEGERLRTGDPRLLGSRYRLLALGYFRDVKLRLDKGSRRGAIVLTVAVKERGTLTLNRIFLGNSAITPIWLGLDVGEASLLGSGIGVGAAFVYASDQELTGGESQLALRLRVSDPSLFGTRLGARASFLHADASEPEGEVARPYTRTGGTLGATYELSRVAILSLDLGLEAVRAGATPPPFLVAGDSVAGTVGLGLDLDTRRDPVLSDDGHHLRVLVEGGGGPLGDYDQLRLLARWQTWVRIAPRHVGSVRLGGGLIAGDAPLFDRFYVGDLNPLLPPRALGLVVSDRPSPDIFGDGMDQVTYGRVYTGASIEYAYQLFRGRSAVYGGDLFASVGVFGLGETDELHLDLTLNAGLRLDTFIGVFELSLGNALGRIPF